MYILFCYSYYIGSKFVGTKGDDKEAPKTAPSPKVKPKPARAGSISKQPSNPSIGSVGASTPPPPPPPPPPAPPTGLMLNKFDTMIVNNIQYVH